MTTILRRVTASASWTGGSSGSFSNILSARASYGFDSRVGQCVIVTPVKPSCTYDDVVTVVMGAGNNITRFVGIVRDFQYSAVPKGVATVLRGYLQRAVEYENPEDPTVVGGLTINDLTGSATATAAAITRAVLTKASVPFTSGNINSTAVLYGNAFDPFIWRNGASDNPLIDFVEAGQTALDYIEQYDAIDAVFTAGSPSTGGRYRTFETLGGVVYRFLVGGRPRDNQDFTFTEGRRTTLTGTVAVAASSTAVVGTGTAFLTELSVGEQIAVPASGSPVVRIVTVITDNTHLTVNTAFTATLSGQVAQPLGDILDGNFSRSITDTRNYFLVTGYDDGSGAGPESFALQDSNTFQSSGTKHTYRLSSPLIERSNDADAGTGMSCQKVADAVSMEFNREIVKGWLTTYRDDALGIAQTHLVQAPGGLAGRLGVAEKLWVQSLDISVDEQGLTQRIGYLGGGAPDTALPDPP